MGRWARAGESATATTSTSIPDRVMPDAYERTLPEVFPDFAPGNFTWDDELEGWVWTTFNEWQWDVNWSNPDVLVEYAEIVLYLANLGVEVLLAGILSMIRANCRSSPRRGESAVRPRAHSCSSRPEFPMSSAMPVARLRPAPDGANPADIVVRNARIYAGRLGTAGCFQPWPYPAACSRRSATMRP